MKPVAWTDGKFCLSFAESDVCPIPLYTAQEYKNPTTAEVMELWLHVINNINANDKRPHEWHFACALLKKASEK